MGLGNSLLQGGVFWVRQHHARRLLAVDEFLRAALHVPNARIQLGINEEQCSQCCFGGRAPEILEITTCPLDVLKVDNRRKSVNSSTPRLRISTQQRATAAFEVHPNEDEPGKLLF